MSEPASRLWAQHAFVAGEIREAVLLEASAHGSWVTVQPGAAREPGLQELDGLALPGLVDAHSHAFQRAFAGLTEQRDGPDDDFWSWRERMYHVAARIGSEELEAVATQLFRELLHGGYTHVCEFHYLHDAAPAPLGLAMLHALVRAAERAGIGLTLLPALYERAGFGHTSLRREQRRFAATADDALRLRDAVRGLGLPRVLAGVAVHSLRAAAPQSIGELQRRCEGDPGPIHIHVAEQAREVQQCLAATGERPIDWLCAHVSLDARWQLVHATHANEREIDAVAGSGAGIVLCPSTEANLGDGLCDLPRWLAAGVPIAIGSDSQVTRSWCEELRWLEYGQRLRLQRRNVAAAPERGLASCAQRLFSAALLAGGRAAGFARWGLEVDAPADLLVLDPAAPALLGLGPEQLLDALVFCGPAVPFEHVMVGGRWVLRRDRQGACAASPRDDSAAADDVSARFAAAMRKLHARG